MKKYTLRATFTCGTIADMPFTCDNDVTAINIAKLIIFPDMGEHGTLFDAKSKVPIKNFMIESSPQSLHCAPLK